MNKIVSPSCTNTLLKLSSTSHRIASSTQSRNTNGMTSPNRNVQRVDTLTSNIFPRYLTSISHNNQALDSTNATLPPPLKKKIFQNEM